ncbi:MAG TPA: hypothetical protein PKZ97_03320 [Azospirillaceae bacterium]|nr:hypothetical protein [Azospirillaceae bacterium]HRQ80124.1 hypothetical protein [Azospirillaceae bacterium]
MNLAEFVANPDLLSRKMDEARALLTSRVGVNAGIKSAADIEALLDNEVIEEVDWEPLYQAAEQFD